MALAHQARGDVAPRLRRPGAARTPVAVNDNHPSGGHCPVCGAWAPSAPIASEYLGGGLIHNHWRCEPCGHAWTTAVRVLS